MIKKYFKHILLGRAKKNVNLNSSERHLNLMFYPKSIAIVGASLKRKKLGSIVLRNIIDSDFSGQILPLNLRETSISNLKTYQKYQDLPVVPDLALIAIPAQFVLESLEHIAQKGTKNIVIFSAGFKEIGSQGLILEKELLKIIKKYELNVLGPNCLGFVNNLAPLNATFGQLVNTVGNLRFISQSGAIATSVFDWAEFSGIGFSEFITLGNKTDLNESDCLEYFYQHSVKSQTTKKEGISSLVPIGMYLESIINGKRFIEIAKKISLTDPIFVLKPGKSSESKKAMQSHTGSIAGEDYVFDVALKKAGILRCDGIEDFFDLAKVFSWENPPKGKNIAIVSNAGGPAVLSSDFVAESGLKLVRFDKETARELEIHLPRAASILNPVDVLGDALAQRYKDAIETLITDEEVHSLLIILTPQVMTQIKETAEIIGKLSYKYKKPIVCSFMGGKHIQDGEKVLNKFKIPSFRYPERAIKAIASMYNWTQLRNKLIKQNSVFPIKTNDNDETKLIISTALSNKRKILTSFEVNDILSSYDINTPPTSECLNVDNALDFINKFKFPVVLKISSPELLHKSDKGGVIINIDNNDDLVNSFKKLQKQINSFSQSKLNSIQIQKQVQKGVELIIGAKKDSTFGNVIAFGAGGILANLISENNLGLVPITKTEILAMIRESKVNKILEGYRGQAKYNITKIVELIFKFQTMLIDNPEIHEVDLNPVIINSDDIWAVDGKIILG